jgi:hypothetical protein
LLEDIMDATTPAPAPAPAPLAARLGIAAEIAALIAHYRGTMGASVSTAQLGQIATAAVASLLRLVKESGANLTQAEVDAVVLEAAGELFDVLAPLLDIPFVPAVIETTVIDPALKDVFLKLVEGAMAALAGIFDRIGWTEPPAARHLAAVPHGLKFLPY